jgi:hypothetical protein
MSLDQRYSFDPPESIKKGKRRLRILLREIRDIDRQLGDRSATRTSQWRAKALTSKAYKHAEYDYLKEEVQELRHLHAAREADVYPPNDPRHLLLRLRDEVSRELREEPNNLRHVLAVIDRYFEHDGGTPDASREST